MISSPTRRSFLFPITSTSLIPSPLERVSVLTVAKEKSHAMCGEMSVYACLRLQGAWAGSKQLSNGSSSLSHLCHYMHYTPENGGSDIPYAEHG